MARDKLARYRGRRNLDRSPEPRGSGGGSGRGKNPIFVIQKHEASTTHYDFRLEVGGVLKSWAVPKGPSTDPRERRLAIQTEDHPLEYADFEGVIPEDEYGGGVVMVWDIGPYGNNKEAGEGEDRAATVEQQIDDGHATVWLEGEKIKGGYALTRTGGSGEKSRWLLVKMEDAEADARRNPTSTENRSAKTGRTMREIESQEDATSFEGSADPAGGKRDS